MVPNSLDSLAADMSLIIDRAGRCLISGRFVEGLTTASAALFVTMSGRKYELVVHEASLVDLVATVCSDTQDIRAVLESKVTDLEADLYTALAALYRRVE